MSKIQFILTIAVCAAAMLGVGEMSAGGKLVPSWSHGLATTTQIQGALYDVITNYFNDDKATAKDTADKMARAVKAAM